MNALKKSLVKNFNSRFQILLMKRLPSLQQNEDLTVYLVLRISKALMNGVNNWLVTLACCILAQRNALVIDTVKQVPEFGW